MAITHSIPLPASEAVVRTAPPRRPRKSTNKRGHWHAQARSRPRRQQRKVRASTREMAWLGRAARQTATTVDYLLREVALGRVRLDYAALPPVPPEPDEAVVLTTSQATRHVKARARPVELATALTGAEYAQLHEDATQAGLPVSRYLLAAALGRVTVPGNATAERLPTVAEVQTQAELHRVNEAGVWMWCAGLETEKLERAARSALQQVHQRGVTQLAERLIRDLGAVVDHTTCG